MRKRPLSAPDPSTGKWLDLESLATVEVSSEQPDFPVENVFAADSGPGWRARQTGEQTIRLVFDEPTDIRKIHLHFRETEEERTHEFALRSGDREIVRQQWNFSPSGSTEQVENYTVELNGVQSMELVIRPGGGHASLLHWRMS